MDLSNENILHIKKDGIEYLQFKILLNYPEIKQAYVIELDKNLEKGKSEIIPAYIDKTGTLSPKLSSIATNEEFTRLQNYINKTIKDISKEIFKGNNELKPYYKNKRTPCEYCSYKNMCGFNSGIKQKNYNFINKLTKDEVLKKI